MESGALLGVVGDQPERAGHLSPGYGHEIEFIVQALQGKPVTIYGDGSQTRTFCYVDDLIEALVRLMRSPAGFTGPVNLGNPEEFTILELARMIIELTGSTSNIVTKELPVDDPERRKPDITLARSHLAWFPQVPLVEGIAKTIDYFDDLLTSSSKNAYRP